MSIAYSTLHFYSVTNHFSEQFRNEELLDCTLNAEGGSIKVHKAILCAQSTLLEKMILDHIHIGDLFFTLDGVLFEDLKSVVEFMYEGRTIVPSTNYSSFLVVAELLGMKWANRVQMNEDDDRTLFCNEHIASSLPELFPLCSITNVVTRHDAKKRSKRPKSVRLTNKIARRSPSTVVNLSEPAQNDKNAFCSALGLRKIQRTFRKSKSIEYGAKDTSNKENMSITGEIQSENAVYIEEKNLPSFLGAEAVEELCFRGKNNIEIECDVSAGTSKTQHFVIYDRNEAAVVAEDIVELREDTAVNAQIFKPENTEMIEGSSSMLTLATISGPSSKRRRKKTGGGGGGGVSTIGKKSSSTKKRPESECGEETAIFWCDVCQRTYHTKTGLNQHKRYECCKDPAFGCPRCGKRFKRKSSLVRHAITLHDETIYPTRTKLLRKLTSVANRNILTISGKRSSSF